MSAIREDVMAVRRDGGFVHVHVVVECHYVAVAGGPRLTMYDLPELHDNDGKPIQVDKATGDYLIRSYSGETLRLRPVRPQDRWSEVMARIEARKAAGCAL